MSGELLETVGECTTVLTACSRLAELHGPDTLEPDEWAKVTRAAAEKLTEALVRSLGDARAMEILTHGMDSVQAQLLFDSLGYDGGIEQ